MLLSLPFVAENVREGLLNNKWLRALGMDASEYARFADLIRQITTNIEDTCIVTNAAGRSATLELTLRLDNVLRSIDHVAWMDERGYL
jgi:hypothetical protein